MQRLVILGVALMLAQMAQAGTPTTPNLIDEQMAKDCKFIGMVSSVRMGTSVTKALNGAMESAMQKAIKLGANAIVIKNSTPQGAFMTVLASAYACPSGPS